MTWHLVVCVQKGHGHDTIREGDAYEDMPMGKGRVVRNEEMARPSLLGFLWMLSDIYSSRLLGVTSCHHHHSPVSGSCSSSPPTSQTSVLNSGILSLTWGVFRSKMGALPNAMQVGEVDPLPETAKHTVAYPAGQRSSP